MSASLSLSFFTLYLNSSLPLLYTLLSTINNDKTAWASKKILDTRELIIPLIDVSAYAACITPLLLALTIMQVLRYFGEDNQQQVNGENEASQVQETMHTVNFSSCEYDNSKVLFD